MNAEERRGLGLLIALSSSGCLGLPRYVGDDDVGDGDGDGEDDDDGPTTQVLDEGPSPEGPEGPAPTTAVDDAESFLLPPDFGPGTTPTTSAESDVTTDPPPPPYEGCQAYSALITECYSPMDGETAYEYCVEYASYIAQYQPECFSVFEELLTCISALSCRDFQTGVICEIELAKYDECRQG